MVEHRTCITREAIGQVAWLGVVSGWLHLYSNYECGHNMAKGAKHSKKDISNLDAVVLVKPANEQGCGDCERWVGGSFHVDSRLIYILVEISSCGMEISSINSIAGVEGGKTVN